MTLLEGHLCLIVLLELILLRYTHPVQQHVVLKLLLFYLMRPTTTRCLETPAVVSHVPKIKLFIQPLTYQTCSIYIKSQACRKPKAHLEIRSTVAPFIFHTKTQENLNNSQFQC